MQNAQEAIKTVANGTAVIQAPERSSYYKDINVILVWYCNLFYIVNPIYKYIRNTIEPVARA